MRHIVEKIMNSHVYYELNYLKSIPTIFFILENNCHVHPIKESWSNYTNIYFLSILWTNFFIDDEATLGLQLGLRGDSSVSGLEDLATVIVTLALWLLVPRLSTAYKNW